MPPTKPVPAGTRYGTMVAVKGSTAVAAKCLYRCSVCGHKRKVRTAALRHQIAKASGATGCVKCDRKARVAAGKYAGLGGAPKPVAAGERYGTMEAVAALAGRRKRGEWRCVTCGHVKGGTASMLKQQGERGSGCPACNRAAKPKRTKEELVEMRRDYRKRAGEKFRAAMKSLPRCRRVTTGSNCKHDKELICVDPGGVEILRCRECDMTGEPAVYAPRAGNLFPGRGRGFHRDEDSPSFENAVRALEDGFDLVEEFTRA